MRISSAESEDNGTYCCKGPQQTLDTCDESAAANLIVVVPPVIAPGQNQTVLAKNNATMVCLIESAGKPPFTVFRWQKSGQRLVADGRKYLSQLIGNKMFLTIVNSTTDDEGFYQCILETPVFQRRQGSVYLTVNHTRTTHTGLTNGAYNCGIKNMVIMFLVDLTWIYTIDIVGMHTYIGPCVYAQLIIFFL